MLGSVGLAGAVLGSVPLQAADYTGANVDEFIAEMTRDYGFASEQLRDLFKQAERKQAILDAISRPAERVKPWNEYRPMFISQARIDGGRQFLARHRQALQQVGGSGDGGIDGVISLDALGLEKVYVQAKRWQSTVGRPELQAFYGALAGQKARRGVFITTSGFTAQAIDFARSVEGLVLVDGKRLVNLMLDHEVGVSSQLYKVPRLDSDYFDESLG